MASLHFGWQENRRYNSGDGMPTYFTNQVTSGQGWDWGVEAGSCMLGGFKATCLQHLPPGSMVPTNKVNLQACTYVAS